MLTHSIGVGLGDDKAVGETNSASNLTTNTTNPTRGRPPLHAHRQVITAPDEAKQKEIASDNEDEESVGEQFDEEDMEIDVDGMEEHDFDDEEEEEVVDDEEDGDKDEALAKSIAKESRVIKKKEDEDEIDIENWCVPVVCLLISAVCVCEISAQLIICRLDHID